jgi:perosamine synthetase
VGLVTEKGRRLPYGRQTIDDSDIAAVVRVLRSDFLTQGPEVRRFEDALCEVTGARYAVAVSSGTAALHLASLAAGVRAGDVGVTSTITFVASGNAIRYAGGRVVFADVDPDTALMSIASLEKSLDAIRASGDRVRLVVPVDMTGAVADLVEVRALAKRFDALVVEDAAHAIGAEYQVDGAWYRAASCAHSDMAILSFHPVKHVTTGEGGAITTNDEGAYRELVDLRTHGITKDPARLQSNDGPWYYEQHSLGFNYRITDVQCALGTSQLGKLGGFLDRRREIARRYDALFASHPLDIRPLRVPPGVRSAYHLYVVRLARRDGESLETLKARRKAAYLWLAEHDIVPQVHYIPVHHQPDFREDRMASVDLPGAEAYYAGCLSLPMFPAMADDDVDRVAETLLDGLTRAA